VPHFVREWQAMAFQAWARRALPRNLILPSRGKQWILDKLPRHLLFPPGVNERERKADRGMGSQARWFSRDSD
jgi:hypothetical protein